MPYVITQGMGKLICEILFSNNSAASAFLLSVECRNADFADEF